MQQLHTPSFITGLCKFDIEHKRIFTYIKLIDSLSDSGATSCCSKISVLGLLNMLRSLFETEQLDMKVEGYTEIDSHTIAHTEFLHEVMEITNEANPNTDMQNVIFFIRDWHLYHIANHDRKLSDFLKKRRHEKTLTRKISSNVQKRDQATSVLDLRGRGASWPEIARTTNLTISKVRTLARNNNQQYDN